MPRIIKRATVKDAPVIIEHRVGNPLIERQDQYIEPAQPEMSGTSEVSAAETVVQEQIAGSLLRAQDEAEKIIDEAKKEAEQIREDAYRQGYNEGQKEGHAEGFQQGAEQAEKTIIERMDTEIQCATQQAQEIVDAAVGDAREMIIAAEKEIIEIALAAARRVAMQELEKDGSGIVDIVRNALRKVSDKEQIEIRVNPDEYEVLVEARCELDAVVGNEKALHILPDMTVQRNGCVIETPQGAVDAQLDTKFSVLRQSLLEVLG